jgi:hypothetical protein
MTGVFDKFYAQAWPVEFHGRIRVSAIHGGTPSSPETARKWVISRVSNTRSPSEVQALVVRTMAELEVSLDAAVDKAVGEMAGLNIFKREASGQLYIEGRQLKAALKEAVSVAANEGKLTTRGWGHPDNDSYRKQIKGWFPEHVFIADEHLLMHRNGEPVTEASRTLEKFIHTHRGDAIGYEEVCEDVEFDFRAETDHEFTEKEWAMIWLTGQKQGIGASRSQSYGQYEVTRWDQVRP